MYNCKNINGFENEIQIAKYLDGKRIKQLNLMFQMFLQDLYGNISEDSIIQCNVDFNHKKFDLIISTNNISKRISVKKGIHNSVHVEGISSFIHFLIDSGVDKEAVVEYLKYHYADGTTNGSGKERISVNQYKERYQEKIDYINKQINTPYILKRAIHRFVLQGKNSDVEIDAILYGSVNDFLWIKNEDIEKIIMGQINMYSTGVHFGPLYCQPMTRCLNHNKNYENKRFCVQIKWYTIFKDILNYMNENQKTL